MRGNISYNNNIKERFIPIEYNRLFEDLLIYLKIRDIKKYLEFNRLLGEYYHKSSYDDLYKMKQNYLPFSPDNELLSRDYSSQECKIMEEELFYEIDRVLNRANYEVLTKDMLNKAINKTSPYGVEVNVNFEDFDTMKIYFRGQSIQKDKIPDPWRLYLKKKTISEPIYRRLVLIIKPKQLEKRAKELSKKRGITLEKARKRLKNNLILRRDKHNRNIYIKLFKNIPQMDLEMLFPNTKVKMKLFDKIKITILGASGTIGGGISMFTKLGTITNPISALIAIGGFIGVLWRQVKNILSKRDQYLAKLAQKLYFYNLANNTGAINYFIDNANDEESKEVILTYIFLSKYNKPITKDRLDILIEEFIYKTYNIKMNFEIDDGIKKLKLLGVVTQEKDRLILNRDENLLDRIRETIKSL